MINKSDSRCAVVRFCYHSYDYRPNWTPLSPITITNTCFFCGADIRINAINVGVRMMTKYMLMMNDIYALLIKSVRSRWLDIDQVLFFFAFCWTEMNIQPSCTNELVKEEFRFAGKQRAIPSRKDRPILPARVGNQNTGFPSSYPLAELPIHNKKYYINKKIYFQKI